MACYRGMEQIAAEALADTRVVVVNGARQVGKSTLANRLGGRFRAGIVLDAGEQQLSFGVRLTALPMAALWTLDGSAP